MKTLRISVAESVINFWTQSLSLQPRILTNIGTGVAADLIVDKIVNGNQQQQGYGQQYPDYGQPYQGYGEDALEEQ